MFNWLKEILDIKYENRMRNAQLWKEQQMGSFEIEKDKKVCESCETLRQQLEIANYEKSQLLATILHKPEPVKDTEPVAITKPRTIPWHVRRQMLETEDREKARIIRNAPKPDSTVAETISTEDLEKELGVAETTRQAEGQ